MTAARLLDESNVITEDLDDASALPRFALYPLVGPAIDPAHPLAVRRWLDRLGERRAFRESEDLQPGR